MGSMVYIEFLYFLYIIEGHKIKALFSHGILSRETHQKEEHTMDPFTLSVLKENHTGTVHEKSTPSPCIPDDG